MVLKKGKRVIYNYNKRYVTNIKSSGSRVHSHVYVLRDNYSFFFVSWFFLSELKWKKHFIIKSVDNIYSHLLLKVFKCAYHNDVGLPLDESNSKAT